jgi:hypothetical protein
MQGHFEMIKHDYKCFEWLIIRLKVELYSLHKNLTIHDHNEWNKGIAGILFVNVLFSQSISHFAHFSLNINQGFFEKFAR